MDWTTILVAAISAIGAMFGGRKWERHRVDKRLGSYSSLPPIGDPQTLPPPPAGPRIYVRSEPCSACGRTSMVSLTDADNVGTDPYPSPPPTRGSR